MAMPRTSYLITRGPGKERRTSYLNWKRLGKDKRGEETPAQAPSNLPESSVLESILDWPDATWKLTQSP